MPVYEYQCKKCTERFEVMQKINDAPLSECSSCGGELKKFWLVCNGLSLC
jgi:putative FmdB family regulatory protein